MDRSDDISGIAVASPASLAKHGSQGDRRGDGPGFTRSSQSSYKLPAFRMVGDFSLRAAPRISVAILAGKRTWTARHIGRGLRGQGGKGSELVPGGAGTVPGTHTAVCPACSRVIGGGGASVLVDRLLDSGFEHVAVLDLSRSALDKARARLGERADDVRWIPRATGLFLTWLKVKLNYDGQAAANLPTAGGTK